MINQSDATFQEVFSKAGSTEAVKLLPWCISAAVPFDYISRPATIAVQQDKGIPTVSEPYPTASEPEPQPQPQPHGSPAPDPSGALTPPPGTPPLPVSSLPDIPLVGTPLMGWSFSDLLAIPSQKKQDHSPSNSPDHHHTRTHVCSPEVEVGVEPSSTWGNQGHTYIGSGDWTQAQFWARRVRTCQSFQPIGLVGGTVAWSVKSTKDLASSRSESSRGNVDNSDTDTAPGDFISCSDTDEVSVQTACKKYQKAVWASCKLSKSNLWMET